MANVRGPRAWKSGAKRLGGFVERAVLLLTALGAIAIAVADATGLLDTKWFGEQIPQITLILVGLLALALASRRYAEETVEAIRDELHQLHGRRPQSFENPEDLYDYVADKIRRAVASVDDITWGTRTAYRTRSEKRAYDNYLNAMRSACRKGGVLYREVSNLCDTHYYERARSLIDQKWLSYNLGYYDSANVEIPLVSYVVIDRQEVIGWFYRDPTGQAQEREVFVSITEPVLVRLFVDYFNTLWDRSTKIKNNDRVDAQLFAAIGQRLKGTNQG